MAGSQGLNSFMQVNSSDLALTEMRDGTLRILLDGIPFNDQSWKPTEMHIARLTLEELKARFTTGTERVSEVNQQHIQRRFPHNYRTSPRFGPSSYH